jgi:hypothetical protein
MKNNSSFKLEALNCDSVTGKQIRMDIDGCIVKINLPANNGGSAKIEAVKRMMLNGLSKV